MCFYLLGLDHWTLTDIYTHRWCLTLRFSSNDTQIMQNQQQLKPSKLWFYDIKITCVTGHVSAPLINRMHNSTMHGGFMNFIDITIIYCKIAAVHSSAGETADHIELAISRITCNELNWIEPTLCIFSMLNPMAVHHEHDPWKLKPTQTAIFAICAKQRTKRLSCLVATSIHIHTKVRTRSSSS